MATESLPRSARAYLGLAVTGLGPSGAIHIHVGASIIIHRAFEANSSFHVKWHTAAKVQFVFFKGFLLALTEFSFREGY